jgi:hypothetical protein
MSQCIARKVPDLCKAYTPGKTDQDINARLTRLEHIVETALPQYCNLASPLGLSSEFTDLPRSQQPDSTGAEDDVRSHSEEQEACAAAGSFQSGKWYGTSVSGSIAPAPVLEQVRMTFLCGCLLCLKKLSAQVGKRGQSYCEHRRTPALFALEAS